METEVANAMAQEPQLPLSPEKLEFSLTEVPRGKLVAVGVARVLMPSRAQVKRRPCDLESLLPKGHRARIAWTYVDHAESG